MYTQTSIKWKTFQKKRCVYVTASGHFISLICLPRYQKMGNRFKSNVSLTALNLFWRHPWPPVIVSNIIIIAIIIITIKLLFATGLPSLKVVCMAPIYQMVFVEYYAFVACCVQMSDMLKILNFQFSKRLER